jgi:hypothetical protein
MFSGAIAERLRAKGHDVLAVVADPALIALPDEQILAHAARTRRALATRQYQGLHRSGRPLPNYQPGIRRADPRLSQDLPQNRSYAAAIPAALSALLDRPTQLQLGQVTFLPRQ